MSEEESKDVSQSTVKFCPICGGLMTQREYIGSLWWFCDDDECGYMEQSL